MMGSYFAQDGFYGTPSATDPNNYRFPIGLGMGPYAQHHQTRAPQDSPYDATCKLYSAEALQNSQQQYKLENKDQTNGYHGSKDLSAVTGGTGGGGPTSGTGVGWPSSGGGSTGSSTGVPVRPAVCTPDGRYVTPGHHPTVEPTSPSRSLSSWNATCSLNNGVVSSQTASQLQQSANHTFYPWMAIAGQYLSIDVCSCCVAITN